jgi:hypothetical protein
MRCGCEALGGRHIARQQDGRVTVFPTASFAVMVSDENRATGVAICIACTSRGSSWPDGGRGVRRASGIALCSVHVAPLPTGLANSSASSDGTSSPLHRRHQCILEGLRGKAVTNDEDFWTTHTAVVRHTDRKRGYARASARS